MNKKDIRRILYTDKDRDLSFRLGVRLYVYSVRPVEETKILQLSKGDYEINYYEKRFNLYNPLTWICIISMVLSGTLSLFIADFLIPLVQSYMSLPKEIKSRSQWDKSVLNSEIYKEI